MELVGSCFKQFVPLIILIVLNLEPSLDKLAAVVFAGEQFGVIKVGMLRDECLFLEILGLTSSHQRFISIYLFTQLE